MGLSPIFGFYTDYPPKGIIPLKIRSFIWRACLNAPVVRQNLKRRHVDLEDVCARCGCGGECQVMEESKCCNFLGASYESTGYCSHKLWILWRQEASIPLINDQPRPPEWDRSEFQAWQKSAASWMKFNYNGAWTQAQMRGEAGWVARDSNGWMEMAGGVEGFLGQPALATEAEAVQEAMVAGLEARVTRMMVETDYKQLVAMLQGDMKMNTSIESIIHDIKVLASHVGQVSFTFVNRRCNAAAHLVAAHVSYKDGKLK
ncbi:uncharacterized protein LOC110752537 [Prunus avium]|uniref:Uncharacterized protein LOC110752537 n=1 Tax=Prunus avium TaxID=42229 RepID=A0A6P5RVQ6_PRUAV|nr:uncharacterized protein LOC110752537 [Prunus avium]